MRVQYYISYPKHNQYFKFSNCTILCHIMDFWISYIGKQCQNQLGFELKVYRLKADALTNWALLLDIKNMKNTKIKLYS